MNDPDLPPPNAGEAFEFDLDLLVEQVKKELSAEAESLVIADSEQLLAKIVNEISGGHIEHSEQSPEGVLKQDCDSLPEELKKTASREARTKATPQGSNRTLLKQVHRGRTSAIGKMLIGAAIVCLISTVISRVIEWKQITRMTQAPIASNSGLPQPSSQTIPPPVAVPSSSTDAPANAQIAARIQFAFNSSELDLNSKKILQRLMEQILATKNPAVEIHGYSDSVGDAAYNQFLSEQRARAVRDYLFSARRLAGVSVNIVGHGSGDAVASNLRTGSPASHDNRGRSRRVEVMIRDSSHAGRN